MRLCSSGLRRRLMFTAFGLAVSSANVTACSGECVPGECDPCVGETCEATCVSPDDEDDLEHCLWACSEGADCSLGCERVDCNLECSASTCTCADCDMLCTDGADCRSSGFFRIGCDASACEASCEIGACLQACINGSTCRMDCAAGRDPQPCRMSCDATSSCQLECQGECLLCCNGSTDCNLDCLGEGMTCEDGTLVCGASCEEVDADPTIASQKCPAFASQWTWGYQ